MQRLILIVGFGVTAIVFFAAGSCHQAHMTLEVEAERRGCWAYFDEHLQVDEEFRDDMRRAIIVQRTLAARACVCASATPIP